jgi:tRNA dimethylallyltransferase
LAARRPGSLHRLLRKFDPATARRIHANDTNKLIRALEVTLLERRPLSELHGAGRDALTGYAVRKLVLNPPRDQLYSRLDRRVAAMFGGGLIEETRAILGRGYSPSAKPFESLGYQQAVMVIGGKISVQEAVADTQLQTRRYAKRQWTWFRREADAEWIAGFGDDVTVQAEVLERIRKFLL